MAIIAASGGSAPEWLETSSAPPVGGDVLDALDLGAEPVAVEELDQGLVEEALDPLGAAPVVELALGLDRGQQLAQRARAGRRSGRLLGGLVGGLRRLGLAECDEGRSCRSHRAGHSIRPPMRSKDQVRKAVWKAMDREGVSRFPGAEGRIPNFAGAKLAAEKLAGHRLWKRARVIKANPDSPQTHVRRAGARGGQDVGDGGAAAARPAPVPPARPAQADQKQVREAATIKGALRHGKVVALEELPEIDFVLCGSVAVNLSGARVGKGGGFSDLEYGLLIEEGLIDEHTVGRDHRSPDPDPARAPAGAPTTTCRST